MVLGQVGRLIFFMGRDDYKQAAGLFPLAVPPPPPHYEYVPVCRFAKGRAGQGKARQGSTTRRLLLPVQLCVCVGVVRWNTISDQVVPALLWVWVPTAKPGKAGVLEI